MEEDLYTGRIGIVLQKIYSNNRLWGGEFLCREMINDRFCSPVKILNDVQKKNLQISFDKTMVQHILNVIASLSYDNLAINIHPESLCDDNFVNWFCRSVHEKKIKPSNIIIEVTECTPFTSDLCVVNNLSELKMSGFRVAMDDFGCKYSNLERYFLMAPFLDYIKINHKIYSEPEIFEHFIHSMEDLILRGAIIAECIENEDTAIYLNSYGIFTHQGYYYHNPELVRNVNNESSSGMWTLCL